MNAERIAVLAGLRPPGRTQLRRYEGTDIYVLGDVTDITKAPRPPHSTVNPASPTGYTIGPGIPGKPWLIASAEVAEGRKTLGFPYIKLLYWWPGGGEFPASEATKIVDSITGAKLLAALVFDPLGWIGVPRTTGGTGKWIVATGLRNGAYFAAYVVPKEYEANVVNYTGNLAGAIQAVRSTGETFVAATKETAKTVVETAGAVYGATVSMGKWLLIGGGILLTIAVAPSVIGAFQKSRTRSNPRRRSR